MYKGVTRRGCLGWVWRTRGGQEQYVNGGAGGLGEDKKRMLGEGLEDQGRTKRGCFGRVWMTRKG